MFRQTGKTVAVRESRRGKFTQKTLVRFEVEEASKGTAGFCSFRNQKFEAFCLS